MTTAPGPTISIAERDRYRAIFNNLHPIDGQLSGDQCRGTFMQSQLPGPVLKQVWDLADMDRDGALDVEEFIVAMRLMYDAINGLAPPNDLPESMVPPLKRALRLANPELDPLARQAGVLGIPSLVSMGGGSGGMGMMVGPAGYAVQVSGQVLRGPAIEFTDNFDWYMSPAERLKYESEFERAPTENDLLAKHHCYEAFVLTRRPNDEFEVVWNIVDLHGRSALTADQYVCMMHILAQRKFNKPFPRSLPPEVIAKFKSVAQSVSGSGTSSAAMSRSTSRGGLASPAASAPVTLSDDSKLAALEAELAFLQKELAAVGNVDGTSAGLVGEWEARVARMHAMAAWFNEHLPLLPSASSFGASSSSALEMEAMLGGIRDEVRVAEAAFAREKSTTI
ncbi:hypothetical protein BC828DRAFT_378394 [Blastocladiella britannica]|nr:hypothetical protein BC828DRAFT_378394 [Blastocladiella britannica]